VYEDDHGTCASKGKPTSGDPPPEIRRALRVGEDDELEFAVTESGELNMRGYRSALADSAGIGAEEFHRLTH
jgi:bifunctional DNA-binding transcriptional regulator/antitoxin component of YhaV-PrlF toxin-antitoxin module